MSSRPPQPAGGASSSGSTPSTNGSSAGNVVPSRPLAAAGEGPLSAGEAPLSAPGPATVPPASRGGLASLGRPTAAASSSGPGKKRPPPAALHAGLLHSYEDKSNDFVWWVKVIIYNDIYTVCIVYI